MKTRISIHLAIFSFILLSCGPGKDGNGPTRTAIDVPEAFTPPAGLAWGDNDCLNPIIDPLDGTELILIQSRNGRGDYRVTERKYGVSKGELLRVNCRTGAVIGIVRGR